MSRRVVVRLTSILFFSTRTGLVAVLSWLARLHAVSATVAASVSAASSSSSFLTRWEVVWLAKLIVFLRGSVLPIRLPCCKVLFLLLSGLSRFSGLLAFLVLTGLSGLLLLPRFTLVAREILVVVVLVGRVWPNIPILAVVVAAEFVVAVCIEEVAFGIDKRAIFVYIEALLVINSTCWVPFFLVLRPIPVRFLKLLRVGFLVERLLGSLSCRLRTSGPWLEALAALVRC